MRRRGTAAKFYARRLAWLDGRPEVVATLPGIRDDVTPTQSQALEETRVTMGAGGLFGRLSNGSSADVQREAIRRLVSELRGERLEAGQW